MPERERGKVVVGFVGPTLDAGKTAKRWEKWRPTVAIFQQPDLLVERIDLIYQLRYRALAELVQEDILAVSPSSTVCLHQMDIVDPWDFEEVFAHLHDFCRAYPFNVDEEDYLLHLTTGTHVAQICMFLLAESRHFPARLLQMSPPPPSAGEFHGAWRTIDLDLSRYDRLASRFAEERREAASFLKAGIATCNDAFNALIDRIEKVGSLSKAPILLTGPTGVGKTVLARRIYDLKSNRRQIDGPFVEVNCATLRGDAAMSALFGHRRGAFTGAQGDRAGLLRAADEGMLFLDEIGELGLDEQAMLLRALEAKTFLPLGSDQEVKSDFQLIAGTNRSLREAVRQGRFREDLLARINLWTFELPGLTARREDIEPNVDFELAEFRRRTGMNVGFNREARQRYLTFATSLRARWEANFRDLNASITRMATLATAGRIDVPLVEEEIKTLLAQWSTLKPQNPSSAIVDEVLGVRLHDYDRFDLVQLADVLEVCRRSRSLSEAGRALFAVSREQRRSKNDADRLRKY
ncbi:MAG: RNA repair transcriptional activator RtcR, partial [Bradymonadaceae bacterium]